MNKSSVSPFIAQWERLSTQPATLRLNGLHERHTAYTHSDTLSVSDVMRSSQYGLLGLRDYIERTVQSSIGSMLAVQVTGYRTSVTPLLCELLLLPYPDGI